MLFSLPHTIFSLTPGYPPPQLFLYAPPIFLYLPYSTPIGAHSLLLSQIHPFSLYERCLQPAHTSPPAYPPCPPSHHPARHPPHPPHSAPPGPQSPPPHQDGRTHPAHHPTVTLTWLHPARHTSPPLGPGPHRARDRFSKREEGISSHHLSRSAERDWRNKTVGWTQPK